MALLDTVSVVANLGNGSGAYEDRFRAPKGLRDIVERMKKLLSE